MEPTCACVQSVCMYQRASAGTHLFLMQNCPSLLSNHVAPRADGSAAHDDVIHLALIVLVHRSGRVATGGCRCQEKVGEEMEMMMISVVMEKEITRSKPAVAIQICKIKQRTYPSAAPRSWPGRGHRLRPPPQQAPLCVYVRVGLLIESRGGRAAGINYNVPSGYTTPAGTAAAIS